MRAGQYIASAAAVIYRHGPKWYGSLFLAAVVNLWFLAQYPSFRDTYNQRISGTILPTLPDELPLWWLASFFVGLLPAWLLLALFHSETLRQMKTPRIFFDEPFVETTYLEMTGAAKNLQSHKIEPVTQLVPIALAKINVRNRPINMEEGNDVKQAHVTAEFREFETMRLVMTVHHPRWTDNPKPRPDEMDKPKFISELNFRDISANNAPSTVDFAIKAIDDTCFHGFRGTSQNSPAWREAELRLDGLKYRVRLLVQGKGLMAPVECWLIVENQGPGKSLKVESEETAECRNWIGVG